jgi:predicted AAA+ superfamily ATPase
MDDTVFAQNNLHHESIGLFRKRDPQLRKLVSCPFVHKSELMDGIPSDIPGIYTVGGGRQVGKTTLLKQWMLKLLDAGKAPSDIWYITGELINDHHQLVRMVNRFSEDRKNAPVFYLLIDEVTYIKDWDKGIKYLADSGMFERAVVVLTGSDLSFIKEARKRFPGRHGIADSTEFLLYPLSFRETLSVKKIFSAPELAGLAQLQDISNKKMDILFSEFERYMVHGGYMTAINDIASYGRIQPATFSTYSDWIRGDMLKRGKKENLLLEILSALIRQHGSQTTWHSIAAATSIDHHATVSDYIDLLCDMEVVFVNHAIMEHKLCAAPKKARKVFFTDPFILHSAKAWIEQIKKPFEESVLPFVADNEKTGILAEGIAIALCRRKYRCFYIKAEKEVDLAYIKDGKIHQAEVKWTNQIRHSELGQILKYPGGVILSKQKTAGEIEKHPVIPLPLWLLNF